MFDDLRPTHDSSAPRGRLPVLAVTFVPPLVLLGVVVVAHLTTGLAFEEAIEDPAGLIEFHPLTGVVSTIGVMAWWTAAVTCLFASALLPRRVGAARRSFLFWSGIVTATLVVDDLFLFHEDLAERYLGLAQRFVVIAYACVAILFVVRFRAIIRGAPDRWLLALAVGLLAASLATDYVHERVIFDRTGEYIGLVIFVEDALKLLGIAAWTAFFVAYAYRAVLVRPVFGIPIERGASVSAGTAPVRRPMPSSRPSPPSPSTVPLGGAQRRE
jgi:hypothetical protein